MNVELMNVELLWKWKCRWSSIIGKTNVQILSPAHVPVECSGIVRDDCILCLCYETKYCLGTYHWPPKNLVTSRTRVLPAVESSGTSWFDQKRNRNPRGTIVRNKKDTSVVFYFLEKNPCLCPTQGKGIVPLAARRKLACAGEDDEMLPPKKRKLIAYKY
jgi:hypothetical protein